jgi:hypothetical protein
MSTRMLGRAMGFSEMIHRLYEKAGGTSRHPCTFFG